jgi:hypothetical protein
MRTLSDFLSTLPTKTSPNGTEKLTALDGSALVGVPNQSYQVVDGIADLPASIPVGVQILTRDSGTMWRGLVAGESSLPAGTPWPVKGYKEYSALLSQSGTNAPVANVLINTIGNIVWSYNTAGLYTATLNGAFLATTTQCSVTPGTFLTDGGDEYQYTFSRQSNDSLVLSSYENLILANGLFDFNPSSDIKATGVIIRIYPPAPTP